MRSSLPLAELVTVANDVASTPARNSKIDLIADLLSKANAREVDVVVGLVSGRPRQGKVGVGWARVSGLPAGVARSSHLTVGDLDTLLTGLSDASGPGSEGRRARLLQAFFDSTTPEEADFVKRLLLGELRQGATTGIVTDAAARAARVSASLLRRAVMLCGDLGQAAETAFSEGERGLRSIGLQVMRPIQPMLATSAPSVADAIEDMGESAVEWKLDGIRVQVHKDGDTVRVWTRNLNEITDRVPEVVRSVARLDPTSLILDGEVLGIDETGAPLAFQETVSTRTEMSVFFFDLLHIDGADLLDEPLRERWTTLRSVAPEIAVPGVVTGDVGEAQAVFEESLDRGHEGAVVKAVGSPYHAGRRGKAWRKVKPVHTLDLVVLAVEHGSGRRRGWLSNIHLGAREPSDGSFVMVGKTFKGMTDEMLEWQTERFGELAIDDDGRVVRLRPDQVVEIAIDGVQASTRYPGGVALRFARVVRYRSDKRADEADTLDRLRSLR